MHLNQELVDIGTCIADGLLFKAFLQPMDLDEKLEDLEESYQNAKSVVKQWIERSLDPIPTLKDSPQIFVCIQDLIIRAYLIAGLIYCADPNVVVDDANDKSKVQRWIGEDERPLEMPCE